MKRFFTLGLATLMAFSLAACSGGNSNMLESNPAEAQSSTLQENTPNLSAETICAECSIDVLIELVK
ncbi:hypothetical protein PaeBR_13895 [Paenibacillus sp. BR2-3]|uniref:hypothetical protein n=1 Tax=Paenibacillus sp. BR2-3 TaxID=3048494 RepID=UPI00397725F9